jgi:hypothetical protein
MVNKLAIAVFGLAVLCTSQVWAGSSGPGWASRLTPTTDGNAPSQPHAQSQQTWVLHGRSVSCASMHGWRNSEYKSHCHHA